MRNASKRHEPLALEVHYPVVLKRKKFERDAFFFFNFPRGLMFERQAKT